MKARMLLLTLALCFAGTALSFAQSPQMGTWKLDEAKSKIPAGLVKNSTVVYATDGDNVKVTTDGTTGDGKPMHTEWTGKFDGKEYPLTGDPTADSRSYKMIDEHKLDLTSKKSGKVINTGQVVVSADGKTRSLHLTGTDPQARRSLASPCTTSSRINSSLPRLGRCRCGRDFSPPALSPIPARTQHLSPKGRTTYRMVCVFLFTFPSKITCQAPKPLKPFKPKRIELAF